ncbi:MAG: glucose-6-phosphate dehydrogenase assembly protein OpcA [Dehalococcoidia bacterium]
MTVETTHRDELLGLDSAELERALSELWQQAAASGDGPPVARTRVMTLVVYTEDREAASLATMVADALPERHPSRGIIVHVSPSEDGPLSAGISIQCLVNPVGERRVCSEQITVTGGGTSRPLLFGAITPLLITDLPATFWWTGRPRPADPVFLQFARGAVDRVVLDSGLFRDPGAGLIALARWKEDRRRRAAIGDLAWERLREWRQLLAQTMDPPEARGHLRSITDVTIEYLGESTIPEESLLLAGWLAATLRWQPFDSPAPGVVTFSAGDRSVTLRLRSVVAGRGVAGIHSVRLNAGGAGYLVRVDDQAGLGQCIATSEAKEPLERMVPLFDHDPVDLIVRALGRRGQDVVYEAALSAAADFVVLGVTA